MFLSVQMTGKLTRTSHAQKIRLTENERFGDKHKQNVVLNSIFYAENNAQLLHFSHEKPREDYINYHEEKKRGFHDGNMLLWCLGHHRDSLDLTTKSSDARS